MWDNYKWYFFWSTFLWINWTKIERTYYLKLNKGQSNRKNSRIRIQEADRIYVLIGVREA